MTSAPHGDPAGRSTGDQPAGDQQVVDALRAASRALVASAARSLADSGIEVTLPQYRALVVLASRGPQRVADIAAELGIDPSTGTRLCDRLVRKGLARRHRSTADRRVVRVSLTPSGQQLVDQVTAHRRRELSRVVSTMTQRWREDVTEGLFAFASAAGEIPEEQWWMGWHPQPPSGPSDRPDPLPAQAGRQASSSTR